MTLCCFILLVPCNTVLLLLLVALVPHDTVITELAADTLSNDCCVGASGGRFNVGRFEQLVTLYLKVRLLLCLNIPLPFIRCFFGKSFRLSLHFQYLCILSLFLWQSNILFISLVSSLLFAISHTLTHTHTHTHTRTHP